MSFLDKIVEKESAFLKEVKAIKETGEKLYIWGAGNVAKNILIIFKFYDIESDGCLVNDKYKTENDISLEQTLSEMKIPTHLIVGFRGYTEKMRPKYPIIKGILNYDCWAALPISQSKPLTYDYLKSEEHSFEKIYHDLKDDKSRETMCAWFNQKISSKYGFMEKVKANTQYFDEDIVKFSPNEVFVDAGAYNGDTAAIFVEIMQKNGLSYKEIISFEPDEKNYKSMIARNLPKHTMIQKGVFCRNEILYFNATGKDNSAISNYGERIEVVRIDDELIDKRPITFIKMDIEGSELDALKGAEETIKHSRPKLAICVYHKRDDLINIYNFIKSLNLNYHFYLRGYENTTNELVLYAV